LGFPIRIIKQEPLAEMLKGLTIITVSLDSSDELSEGGH
jgi:hypothetical protein